MLGKEPTHGCHKGRQTSSQGRNPETAAGWLFCCSLLLPSIASLEAGCLLSLHPT